MAKEYNKNYGYYSKLAYIYSDKKFWAFVGWIERRDIYVENLF